MASLSNKVSKYPEEQWIPAQPAPQKKRASALDERKAMPAADVRQLRRPAAAKKGAMAKAQAEEVDPEHAQWLAKVNAVPEHAQWLAKVDAMHEEWVRNKLPREHKGIDLCEKICYGPPGLRSVEFISNLITLIYPPKQADELIKLDEFAAGNAFWSYKFHQTGKFKVRALDSSHLNNIYRDEFPHPYYPVIRKPNVVPEVRKRAAESVLFASWLPQNGAGNSCLQAYEEGKGRLFICEGEEEGGSCADAAFFEKLRTNWVRLGVPNWAQTLKRTFSQALQVYVPKDFEMNPCEVPQDMLDQKSYSCILTLLQFSLQARKILNRDSLIYIYLDDLKSAKDITKMDDFLKGLIPHMQDPKLATAILLTLNTCGMWFSGKTLPIILSANGQDSLEILKQVEAKIASLDNGHLEPPQNITKVLEEFAKKP